MLDWASSEKSLCTFYVDFFAVILGQEAKERENQEVLEKQIKSDKKASKLEKGLFT